MCTPEMMTITGFTLTSFTLTIDNLMEQNITAIINPALGQLPVIERGSG